MSLPLPTLTGRERQRFAIDVLHAHDLAPAAIAAALELDRRTVRRWQQRQEDDFAIWDAPRSGRPRLYGKDLEDRFIAFYCQSTPLGEVGRWTLRWAECALKNAPEPVGAALSRSTMQRMLRHHCLQPHRNLYFLQITDPDFFPKMDRIIALYLDPPANLICFDESPGIQILQRMFPQLRPGDDDAIRQWLQDFDYVRHGTTDLLAFFNVNTGQLAVSCHADHTKVTFLAQFRAHAAAMPADEPLHYIMDNLDSHCCYEFCELVAEFSGAACPPPGELANRAARRAWLEQENKRVVVHFTPFHGSWLNQVEVCFRLINQHCLKGSYSSPDELRAAILTYVADWNQRFAHPFNWTYDGKGLEAKAVRRFIAMLERPAAEMRPQFITKGCRLMLNLAAERADAVPHEDWRRLTRTLGAQEEKLRQLIQASKQPIVKSNARAALEELLQRFPSSGDAPATSNDAA